MNRESVNWWFTITANIGVLAGLVFVGLEIQQNTSQLRLDASFSLTEAVNEQNSHIYQSAELTELLLRGEQDLGALDPVEHERFASFQFSRLNVAESMEDLRREGVTGLNFSYVDYIVRQYQTKPGLQAFIRERQHTYVGSSELLARLVTSEPQTQDN